MAFKFEKLEVWELALEYVDLAYQIGEQLPRSEEFNLKSQLIRARHPLHCTTPRSEVSSGRPTVDGGRQEGE